MRARVGVLLFVGLAAPLSSVAAQRPRFTLSGQFVLADYREQSPELRFRGQGPSVSLDVQYKKLGLELRAMQLNLDTLEGLQIFAEPFEATQLDARLRYFLLSAVSFELGFLRRTIDPELAAQEVGAFRLGIMAAYALAPGASLRLRAGYLAAAKFSGGGRAPFAMELGLGVSYGPGAGRVRATGDYEFQRIDRKTANPTNGDLKVPIQTSVARLGLAVVF